MNLLLRPRTQTPVSVLVLNPTSTPPLTPWWLTGLAVILLTSGAWAHTFTITVPSSITALAPVTFSYNGTNGSDGSPQTYTVPSGVFSLSVVANGAAGGDGTNNGGGRGGKVEGLLAVTPGQVLTITIGGTPTPPVPATGYNGGGYNGGGKSAGSPTLHSGGGGGATDIRQNGNALTNRVIVAGGGGGGNVTRSGNTEAGVGGGLTGGAAGFVAGGGGGTQSAGGAGGSGSIRNGRAGSLAVGGDGLPGNIYASGGGGGGYYGGGSGGENSDPQGVNGLTGSGGGGSSYTDPTRVTNVVHTQGAQSGSGQIVIVPLRTVAETNIPPVATANNNQTATLGMAFTYTVNAFTDANADVLTYSASISPANGFSFDAATRIISGMPGTSGVSSVTVTATDPGSLSASTTFTITVPSSITALAPVTFSYNGTNGSDGSPQTYTVPSGVFSLSVVANGAAGGDASSNGGGRGGKVEGLLAVTPGQVLTITIGGTPTPTAPATGYNGGGSGAGNGSLKSGGGGGATDIRQNGNALTNRVIVAGGGGGGNVGRMSGTQAGVGGGLTGGAGRSVMGGRGGTQSAGGAGGSGSRRNGQAGSLAVGGDGFSNGFSTGGGGGGYYGGGGGGEQIDPNFGLTGSGGGGSSYTDPTRVTNVVHTQGAQSGSGQIVIVPLRTVAETNTPPVATANNNQTATVGVAFSYTVNAFSDSETPNSLTYTASINPANGFVFDAATRVISGTPTNTGVSSVTVTATDPGNLSASTTFTITVNPAPVVVAPLSLNFTASPMMILTSGTTTLSATVSGGTTPYSYTFSGPGTITPNGNTASVSGLPAGVQSFTVLVRDSTMPASQTITGTVNVTVTPANTAPVATANDNQTATVGTAFTYTVNAFTDPEGQPLTYSARIDPANGFSFNSATRVISGTPSMSGVSSVTLTATDPGSLSASTMFTITVNPAPVVVPPAGPFSITGVTTVSCQAVSAGLRRLSFTPQYTGTNGQPISFSVVNEMLPTTSPGPYTLNLYTDNPVVTLKAVQQGTVGEASFTYHWLAVCNTGTTPPANQAPTTTGIPNQNATVGQGFSLNVAPFFADPNGDALGFAASGLPTGLSLSGSTISGIPAASSVSSVTLTATDPGNLSAKAIFELTVNPAAGGNPPTTAPFAITGVTTVSCQAVSAGLRQLRFTPQYAGTNGQPISFSVVNELLPSPSPGPYTLNLYTDNPVVTLKAVQQGTAGEASFTYHWLAACNTGSKNRIGVAEPRSRFSLEVLGNPVREQLRVRISGVEGQAVRLRLTDLRGRELESRLVESAGAANEQRFDLGQTPAGMLVLQAVSQGQTQVVKILHQ